MTSEPSAGTGPTSDDAEGAVFTGRRLGVYQVYEQLGAGGMGEVYRARDTRLGRDVAVKILPRAFVADPDRLARFEREARVLAALNHPNIATIHGIEETGSISALGMELVDGATLGGDPKISSDGKRIAVRRGTPPQIWVVDIDRGVAGPFGSQESSGVGSAAWSPDGQIVAVMRGAPPNLFLRGADGTDRRLTNTRSTQQLWDWSRDGRLLLYTESQNTLNATTRVDLWVVPTADNEAARQLTRGPSSETQGRFSPDGRWITYTSDESGRNEIYLRRVDGGMNWRVSTAGGSDARWRADGREVFYRAPDGTLMSVNVRTAGNTPELGSPVTLFKIPAGYDTSADGQRFLALASVEKAEASPMIVVTNWQTDLQGQGTR